MTDKTSMEASDAAAAAVAKKPRVTLDHLKSLVAVEQYLTGAQFSDACPILGNFRAATSLVEFGGIQRSLESLTICLLVLRNGWTVIGKSAPADPENFDHALGRKFAYEDAIRQLWPLEGYLLKDRLHKAAETSPAAPVSDPDDYGDRPF